MSALRVEVPEIIQLPRFVLCWNGLEPAHSKEHIIPMDQKIPSHYLFGTNMAFRGPIVFLVEGGPWFLGAKIKPINHALKQPFSWEFEISKFLNISKRKCINGTRIQLRFTKHFHGWSKFEPALAIAPSTRCLVNDSVVDEAPQS
jgi:hypothetical protein